MPSVTSYTSTLKPFSPVGSYRSYATGPMLVILGMFFVASQIHEEYCRFVDRQTFAHAQTWPSTICKIENYAASPVQIRDGKYSHHTEYEVQVNYSYKANGRQYEASQEKFLDHENRMNNMLTAWTNWVVTYRTEAERMLASEFAKNSNHTVRYDPSDPSKAFVDVNVAPENSSDNFRHSTLISAAILVALAIGLVNSGITKMR